MFAQESVMDLQKEREAFERLPLAELAIKSEYVYYNEETNSYWPNEDFCPSDAPETMSFAWEAWQAAKAQAVPEKDAVIKKLSDQLYAQEMKASAARVLCETACELLDGYAHQDAMVILNDLEQAMKEPTND